jgi:hypothetical protein
MPSPALSEKLTPSEERSMSAFPSTANLPQRNGHVGFVPLSGPRALDPVRQLLDADKKAGIQSSLK